MSDYDLIFSRSKRIESLLDNWGAEGRGLHEKVSSVQTQIPDQVVRKIRFIASVRNKVAHETNYVLDDATKQSYIQAAEFVESNLLTPPSRSQPLPTSSSGSGAGGSFGCLIFFIIAAVVLYLIFRPAFH